MPIAYETNVTDIPNFYNPLDNQFDLSFINKDSEGSESEFKGKCNFLKYDNNPLLLVCWVNGVGENRLNEITKEIIIENNNIQYNYRIQPVKNEELIHFKGEGSFISWNYPKVLNFSNNDGPKYIEMSIENPNYLNGFTYNEDANDLTCNIIGKNLITCEVTKEHFKGKKNGLYFLKHKNHLEKKSISYEIAPMNIILDSGDDKSDVPSNGNIISLSLFYSLMLVLFMV